jgi:hypothetical protein
MGQEVEDISRHHLNWFLVDHREEDLQIEGNGAQRIGSRAPRHELQIRINQWMAQ